MKLFVGICNSQESVPSSFFWSFINIQNKWEVEICRGKQPWDIVRNNYLVYRFLRSNADIFIKMDIDQTYPTAYFLKLVPLVEKYKVIGPLIKDRHIGNNYMPLAFTYHDGNRLQKFDVTDKTGIVEIPYAHTNLFIAREVLEKISAPWYEVTYSEDGLSRKNHVDFTFLDKIKNSGYPIYIDLDMKVGHKKPPEYVT